jgi:hypothetical protein
LIRETAIHVNSFIVVLTLVKIVIRFGQNFRS